MCVKNETEKLKLELVFEIIGQIFTSYLLKRDLFRPNQSLSLLEQLKDKPRWLGEFSFLLFLSRLKKCA